MALFNDGGVFVIAGGLLVLGLAAVWQAVEGLRWREPRRALVWSGAAVPLIGAALAMAWFGLRHPGLDLWSNRGLGPDWECPNLGRGAADVCVRDARPQPAAAPSDAKPQTPSGGDSSQEQNQGISY